MPDTPAAEPENEGRWMAEGPNGELEEISPEEAREMEEIMAEVEAADLVAGQPQEVSPAEAESLRHLLSNAGVLGPARESRRGGRRSGAGRPRKQPQAPYVGAIVLHVVEGLPPVPGVVLEVATPGDPASALKMMVFDPAGNVALSDVPPRRGDAPGWQWPQLGQSS